MGLLPVEDDRGAGKLFRGDGVRAQGWYRAWPEGSFTVVTCDFTMLLDTLFAVDTPRYLTVRSPMSSSADHGAATGPAAIAYIETREERVTTPVPAGSHFAYAEVEYFEDALRGAFADLEWNSIGALSALLADMRGGVGWIPGILPALDGIARVDPTAPGAALIYEGAAKTLLGALVGTVAAALPKERRDRAGILAAIELAHARWREGASQAEAAAAAGMGPTKFKRLFRQATGRSWGVYLAAQRMREAQRLLAGGMRVAEAAHAVGYRSPTSFSATFAKWCGMTPSDYREATVLAVRQVGGI